MKSLVKMHSRTRYELYRSLLSNNLRYRTVHIERITFAFYSLDWGAITVKALQVHVVNFGLFWAPLQLS